MLDRQILQAYAQFDIIVRHEAEETLPPLLAKLETRAFDGIPGITWRDGRNARRRRPPAFPRSRTSTGCRSRSTTSIRSPSSASI